MWTLLIIAVVILGLLAALSLLDRVQDRRFERQAVSRGFPPRPPEISAADYRRAVDSHERALERQRLSEFRAQFPDTLPASTRAGSS